MTSQTKERIILLTKIGLVGTALGVPIGLWAMDRWPGEAWKTAALLTAVSFYVKDRMMHPPGLEGGGHA